MKFPEPTFMQNMENKTKIKFWSTPCDERNLRRFKRKCYRIYLKTEVFPTSRFLSREFFK